MRIHRIVSLAALVITLAAATSPWPLAPSHSFAGDWPQFLGPTRNATSAETGLLQSWPKEGPPKLWEKKLGDGYSAPVIAGERLIVFHRTGDKEVVESLDPATGKEQW